MKRLVTFQGKPLNLIGQSLQMGQKVPAVKGTAQDLSDHPLGQYKGKTIILTTFPSLDTPVCEIQMKTFNREAAELAKDIVIIAVSMDLPFAQNRFCNVFNTNNIVTLSDYKYLEFGLNFGVLIKELKLLTRSAFIINKDFVLQYAQISDEITEALDYDDVLKELKRIVENPSATLTQDTDQECSECATQKGSLEQKHIRAHLEGLDGWTLENNIKIKKTLEFKDFLEALAHFQIIAQIAESINHHPVFNLDYNKLTITLWTHSVSGLTVNDFILAKKIDHCFSPAINTTAVS